MSEIAMRSGGTIDKIIGDSIMVFFGDPESRGIKNDALKLRIDGACHEKSNDQT